jgi:sodium transport system permease protein
MNWANVKLIFAREVRDQLRDRRTLFMIAVLPVLLYPLLGMTFFQVAQFIQEHAVRVLIVGDSGLPADAPLFEQRDGRRRFAAHLFREPKRANLLDLSFAADVFPNVAADELAGRARLAVQDGEFEVAVVFPAELGGRLQAIHDKLAAGAGEEELRAILRETPGPELHYNTAREASAIGYARVSDALQRWTDAVGRRNLTAGGLPELAAQPFSVAAVDVADAAGQKGAAVWSKVLPFLLLIWALTGAFYPAVDLCAGEKERGTLETLLSSPARRVEIVMGKLLTIMSFSVATAVLNLLSMGITGQLILSQLPDFGPPPLAAPLWLAAALLPMSALFSAICLALAAFARSSKEGQYYLMPVLLITMPLAILPMSPGFELNLGNALIPVTGVVLLLRAALEGAPWQQVLPYVPPVVAVTLGCCALAVRWAVDQFNSESVLFRESERFDLGLWLRHLARDRQATPNAAMAAFCGVLILLIRFFMGFALPQPDSFGGFATLAVVTQLVVILTPALLMTIMLTRGPRQTLLLTAPPWATLPAAVLLAVSLHPAANLLQQWVVRLYPVSDGLAEALEGMLSQPHSIWQLLLVMAVVPALCEELAFRGFILSGFRHLGSKWRAIALASLCFALAHAILQQSMVAFLVGMVIGYLAVQSGSILPCMLFHAVHNSLALLMGQLTPEFLQRYPALRFIVRDGGDAGFVFQPLAIAVGGFAAVVVLVWFHRLRYHKTAEETLHEAIEEQELVGT